VADTLARLRRSVLLVPRLMRAHREGTALSLNDLAATVGTSPTVLHEDLDALAAVEFDSDERPNYFSFDVAGDSLRVTAVPLMLDGHAGPARLTEPEASALLGFLDEIEFSGEDHEDLEGLATAVARAAGSPEDVRSWFTGGPIPSEDVFRPLLGAARDGRRCRITYTASGGSLYEVLIDPYHLRMERGMWYVIARRVEGEQAFKERVYRVDKVTKVEVLEAYESDPIDLDRYADGVFVPSGEPRVERVAFSPKVAPYAVERWGDGELNDDGWTEIDIEYFDEGWLERTLAVFGGEVLGIQSG